MVTIYESFENLEEEKKDMIINAGFKVFGEDGYKKASVDSIVKEASISKGSLFYYFSSKKNFFLFLYDYCALQMKKHIDRPGNNGLPAYMENTDFFERIKAVQVLKLEYASKYPHMNSFMKRAVLESDPDVRLELSNINQQIIKERTIDFYQGLDLAPFKEDIDPKMILQLITWCSEGCSNLVLQKMRFNPTSEIKELDFTEAFQLFHSYMELFKKNFYKEDYL